MKRRLSPGLAARAAIAFLALAAIPLALAAPPPDEAAAARVGAVAGRTARMAAPQRATFAETQAPDEATAEQRSARESFMRMAETAWESRRLTISPNPVAGPAGPASASAPGEWRDAPDIDSVTPNALPADPVVFSLASLVPPSGRSSEINEPAVSQSGRNLWVTHNWYAARSINAGATWTYVNPYKDFSSFCCDQDAVYDRGRDIHIWYRQGVVPSGQTQNTFKVSVSRNDGATWCTYTTSPTNVDAAWTGRWFDYPRLALSNNFLYVTTNLFVTGGGFDRIVLLRWPLDQLRSCTGFSYSYWTQTDGWTWSPVEGATSTMYLGDHYDTSSMYVYSQPESSTSLSWVVRTIPAWSYTNRDGTCTGPGGSNPCGRADQRITGGWVRKGEIGFFWNVKEGNGFPFPYVESATFAESTLSYLARPLIWNPDLAFQYASAAPNDRGDLGMGVYIFNATTDPWHVVAMDDGFDPPPPGWTLLSARTSTGSVQANAWGDYARVRPFAPQGVTWIATGATIRRPATGLPVGPTTHVVLFGRGRDEPGHQRYRLK